MRLCVCVLYLYVRRIVDQARIVHSMGGFSFSYELWVVCDYALSSACSHVQQRRWDRISTVLRGPNRTRQTRTNTKRVVLFTIQTCKRAHIHTRHTHTNAHMQTADFYQITSLTSTRTTSFQSIRMRGRESSHKSTNTHTHTGILLQNKTDARYLCE